MFGSSYVIKVGVSAHGEEVEVCVGGSLEPEGLGAWVGMRVYWVEWCVPLVAHVLALL